jgi:hypothetical protein
VLLDIRWAAGLSAAGAVTTPIAVAIIGVILNRQLKRLEAQQWRNQELITARLAYYRELAEPLNDLMCYFTFIGAWKDFTPPEIIALKRDVDRKFHTLSPFFSIEVVHAYDSFMNLCFSTFGKWGADAKLKTSFRRRKAGSHTWQEIWESMFVLRQEESMPPEDLEAIKVAYNEILARLVGDIQLTTTRTNYASAQVVLNA